MEFGEGNHVWLLRVMGDEGNGTSHVRQHAELCNHVNTSKAHDIRDQNLGAVPEGELAANAQERSIRNMHGLLELVLEVSDLDRSLAFYRDLLGLHVVERWPAPRLAAWVAIGRNAVLGLWPASSGGEGVGIAGSRGGSHVHFAIYIDPGSLVDWQKRLELAGIKVEGPVTFAHGNHSIFFGDPDGNVVELGDWSVDWAGEDVLRKQ
jgi:catechol 2,3-dioxygenase-like lactoylglutathione lyase family enzyme